MTDKRLNKKKWLTPVLMVINRGSVEGTSSKAWNGNVTTEGPNGYAHGIRYPGASNPHYFPNSQIAPLYNNSGNILYTGPS